MGNANVHLAIRMQEQLIGSLFRFHGDKPHTRYLEIAYIVLLPIAVWFLYRLSIFNNEPGFIDPWIYFGYVHNFEDLIDRYGLLYYSVRFGFLFPLIVFVNVFGPVNGYLAFVYSMYLLPGVSLYLLFRKRFSVHAATLAYAVLVSSAWFARTVLWTYPDASAVPYLLAATALILLDPTHRRLGNFTVGVLIAMATNSNIFALSIAGLSAVAYAVYYKDSLWARLRRNIPWMAAGFLFVLVGGMVGYYVCCRQFNYFSSTHAMVRWSVTGSGVVYQLPLSKLLALNYLYLLPTLLLSLSFVSIKANGHDRGICLAAASYLGAVMLFVVGYEIITKMALLEIFHYVSFLLVPVTICVVLVLVILAKHSYSEQTSLNVAIGSVFLLQLLLAYEVASIKSTSSRVVVIAFAVVLLLLLATTVFKRMSALVIVCFIASLLLSLLSTGFYAGMYGSSGKSGLSTYRLALKFIEAMPKFRDQGRPIYFWYSSADQLANSLQSAYLWGYSRIMDPRKRTEGFPLLDNVHDQLLRKRSSLVVFHRDRQLVNQGIEELHHLGVRFTANPTTEICEKEICYAITVLDVSGMSENSAPRDSP
jgi:hypothetical protein